MHLENTCEDFVQPCFGAKEDFGKSLKAAYSLLSVIKSAGARKMLEYYIEIHPADRLPNRENFNPMAIPSILPNIVLVDVVRNPFRFKYRLAGTEVYNQWGFEVTGKYIDELVQAPNTKHSQIDRVAVVATRQPIHRFGMPDLEFRTSFREMEYLHLPFAEDGQNVDMILSYLGYWAC